PPIEALARGTGEMVVVVVPALAEREQSKPGVVARVIARCVAPRAEPVVERDGRDAEAPYDELRAGRAELGRGLLEPRAETVKYCGEQHRNGDIEPVEPAQLRIAREIRYEVEPCREVLAHEEPAEVAPQEAVLVRRVAVRRAVGM